MSIAPSPRHLHAGGRRIELGDVGPPPDGPQDGVHRLDRHTVRDLHRERVAGVVPFDPLQLRLDPNLDSVGFERAHELGADHVVEGAQHPVPTKHHGDFAPEGPEHACELDCDVSAAGHDRSARPLPELEEPVRRDAELCTRRGRHDREPPGRDGHVVRREAGVADRHGARSDETGRAPVALDTLGLQAAGVDAVQPLDVGIPGPLERRPVELLPGYVEPVSRVVVDGVAERRRVPHQLLGDAADVDAGSAEPPVLDDGGARAVVRSPDRGRNAAAAAADGEKVETMLRHFTPRRSSRPWP